MQKRTLLHERPSGHVMVGLFVLAAVFLFAWLLVFKEEEVERFQACLRFKIGATKEEVQEVIDEVLEK